MSLPPSLSSPQKLSAPSLALLLLLLLITDFFLRSWLWQPPVGSDDLNYFRHALEGLSDSERAAPAHGALRLLLSGLIALPNQLFQLEGGLEAFYGAIALQSLLSFIGIALLAFAASRDQRAALLVILLWSTSYAALLTEAKLLPDGFGTALAMIGSGLFFSAAFPTQSQIASTKRLKAWMLLSGLLLWGAFSIRATFATYPATALLILLATPRLRQLLPALLAGGVLGALIEWIALYQSFGDPLIRLKVLLNYQTGGTTGTLLEHAASTAGAASFTVWQKLWILFSRFPHVLYNTGSAEIFLFLGGLLGAFVWLIGRGEGASKRRALGIFLILGFGLLAFAIKGFEPLRPYLRESVRYYLQAAPLFYLLSAGLAYSISCWLAARPIPLFKQRPSLLALLLLSPFIGLNLWAIEQSPHLAKNGNDGLFKMIRLAQQRATASQTTLYGDGQRLSGFFFTQESGWKHVKSFHHFPEPGFLLIDWRKRNYNVQNGYSYGVTTHTLYDLAEHYPIIARHQNGIWVRDLLLVGPTPIQRQINPLVQPQSWQALVISSAGEKRQVRFLDAPLQLKQGEQLLLRSPNTPFTANQLLQLRLITQATGSSPATLSHWLEGDNQRTFMGQRIADQQQREMAVWGYGVEMPRATVRIKVERGEVNLDKPQLLELSRHPQDSRWR
uniref:Glycosyltransferase RgtA/B/C/D-like domain-containing protein n=1 Tax=Magnetococcus massalia (strain MO-1) TaxID=451514 RepID=A0A1S7LEN2_MAGMO|nr:conserved membrane protein of unknown function [Candidatus Magnetococcus massalia]